MLFLAGLQSNSGSWKDVFSLSVRPTVCVSDVNNLVNLFVKVLKLALQSGHTVLSSFLFVISYYKNVKLFQAESARVSIKKTNSTQWAIQVRKFESIEMEITIIPHEQN